MCGRKAPGRHAKVVSTASKELLADGNDYRTEPPLTGDESVVAEVEGVEWPELLTPVDDLPPATVVTSVRRQGDMLVVRGVSQDNGKIVAVMVNGRQATVIAGGAGVVDWEAEVPVPRNGKVSAFATDEAGNAERTVHEVRLP